MLQDHSGQTFHQVIPLPQAPAPPEVVNPALMLPRDQIDAPRHQQRGGKVFAVIAVGQDDVAEIQFS